MTLPLGWTDGSRDLTREPGAKEENGEFTMPTIAFAMPIIPGKEPVDRANIERVAAPGPAHDEHAASRRSQGVKREIVFHQETPNGTLAVVVIEADDVETAMGAISTSDDPKAKAFREEVKEVHGVDMATEPPPKVELIADIRF